MAKVTALRSDGYYVATFREPAFGFIQEPLRLYEQIYKTFGPSNVRPEDIRVESGRDPQDFLMVCTLLDVGATLRFRLRTAEVWSADTKVLADTRMWSQLVQGAIQVSRARLTTNEAHSPVEKHSFILATHWELKDADYASWLGRWVGDVPPGMAPSGCTFFSEKEGLSVSVQAEPSAWFKGPAFGWARVLCDLAGTTAEGEACDIADREIAAALEAIGLDFTPAG